MKIPKATVLPESSLVPNHDLIQPPPNQFTHKLKVDQLYRYAGAEPSAPPDGTLHAGTNIVLLSHDGGPECYVVDGRGLHVVIPFVGLIPFEKQGRQHG